MNAQQMDLLANESADRILRRVRHVMPQMSDEQADVLLTALGLCWMEGFGRGHRQTSAIVDRAFDEMLKKLTSNKVEGST